MQLNLCKTANLKMTKNGLRPIRLNAGQKYCRMLPLEHSGEHSAILLTFIKLPVGMKILVLSMFGWPFYTGFTVWLVLYILQGYNLWNTF